MEAKEKRRKVVVSLLALAGLLVFSLQAIGGGSLEPSAGPGPIMKTLDEVEPRIPIHASDLPLTITEPNSYYLVEDVSFTNTLNHAITIECNDVTIDLMGYTLKGPDSGDKSGIYMDGRSNVEVRNGTVRDFHGYGIREADSTGKGHRFINVRAMSNRYGGIMLSGYGHLVKDCTVVKNGSNGIWAGYDSVVTGNTAYNNGGTGIEASRASVVTGNTASNNNNNGISAGESSTVTGNTVYNNGQNGIYTRGSTVTGNTVRRNKVSGIRAENSCTVIGNTASLNTRDGIRAEGACKVIDNTCDYNGYNGDGAGILVLGSGNHIEGNNVASNDRGIDVNGTDNLIVKNSAAGNTIEYSIVGGNKYGTISTDPTTAGPWDNFAF